MEERQEKRVDVKPCVLKSALGGVIALAVVVLLFGGLAHHWVMGWMAGVCCAIGVALCVFTRTYFKAMEEWYKAHPQPQEDEAQSTQDATDGN